MTKRAVLLIAMLVLCAAFVSAQSQSSGSEDGFKFTFGLGIGVANFPNLAYTGPSGTEPVLLTYQSVALTPEFAFGKIGVGLNLAINYNFNGGTGKDQFQIRPEDWVVGDFQEFLNVYLPKIAYVRYGRKGEPLYAKFGTVTDAVLGNGFIMNAYSNALFLPEKRIFGLNVDLDGSFFQFPFLGFESVVGNVATLDVLGMRLFARPLIPLENKLLQALQIGFTVVTDRDSYSHYTGADPRPAERSVLIYGADIRLPIISDELFSLAAFGDMVNQNSHWGGMIGTGGSALKFLIFGAQLRFLGDNFIPEYFGTGYDLFRTSQFAVYNGTTAKPGIVGWLAKLGFSLFDLVTFYTSIEGPFTWTAGNYPVWKAILLVRDKTDQLPLSIEASYEKREISTFEDIYRWQENAVMIGKVNYKMGTAILSFVYNLRYDPTKAGDRWIVTSGLETKVSF